MALLLHRSAVVFPGREDRSTREPALQGVKTRVAKEARVDNLIALALIDDEHV